MFFYVWGSIFSEAERNFCIDIDSDAIDILSQNISDFDVEDQVEIFQLDICDLALNHEVILENILFFLVAMIQKAVYSSAGRRAPSAPKFWASSFPWKFFLTFFWKKFWKLKNQCKSFLKNVYMPEYWRHHILKINY
jgi:hypothetical protein